MDTTRLTVAQAIVRFLIAQRTEIDGEVRPLFPGVFAIFGHGNVTCLGDALDAARETRADLARSERADDGDGRGRVRQGHPAPPDHGRDHLDRSGGAQHGDRGGHRACQPASVADDLGRHVREPAQRSGAAAGRALRRALDHGERRLQSGHAGTGTGSCGPSSCCSRSPRPSPRCSIPPIAVRPSSACRRTSRHRRSTFPRRSSESTCTACGARARPGGARGRGRRGARRPATADHRRRRRPLLDGRGTRSPRSPSATACPSWRPWPGKSSLPWDHPRSPGRSG